MIDTASRLASTTDIAAAFLANNKLGVDQVADLVVSIGASLDGVEAAQGQPAAQPADRPTAAAIRKSIGTESLISFEDGKAYRTLKRHLSSRGLTPQAYRVKWGLPGDYPMVAPAYSAARSQMAHRIGLGRGGIRSATGAKAKTSAKSPAKTPETAPRPRGRPPKARAAEAAPAKTTRAKPAVAKGRAAAPASRAKTKPATAKPSGTKTRG